MSQYDIVALGNALVDKEFTVSEQFLAENEIEKGFMTLFESEPHSALLDKLSQQYDLRKQASGGCAANSLVTAAQFGAKTFYCCRVGNDDTGQFYQTDLAAAGVEHDLHTTDYEGTTGTCVVMVTDDADRTMCTHLGITTGFSVNDLNHSAIQQSQYLYIEGHLMYQESAVEAILTASKVAAENNVKIAVTFSDPSVVNYAKSNLEKVLNAQPIDMIFCNQDEVVAWAGDKDKGIQALRNISKTLVVTKGSEGATIYTQEKAISIQPYPVTAIDTTGAGDTFAGAFMYGVTKGLDLEKCGALASRCAAECVANFGPRLSKNKQLELLSEVIA